jgi:hypothetical protein
MVFLQLDDSIDIRTDASSGESRLRAYVHVVWFMVPGTWA